MSNRKRPLISENPSAKELSDALPLVKAVKFFTGCLKKLGFSGERINKINEAAETIVSQADVLNLPDRFNTAFADLGWIATNSMSDKMMRKALAKFEAGEQKAAEAAIMEWFSEDTIRLFAITRSKRFNKATNRWHQLNEAWELTKEERYYSAIPLILVICDGFASDVMESSPFKKDADLTLFDSIVGHKTSLPALISMITKGVKKSSNDPVEFPFRHGILHGRTLGYADRKVCLKAWMLFIALVDWAIDKQTEDARKAKQEGKDKQTWAEIVALHKKNQANKAEIEAFEAAEWKPPFETEANENGPVFAFLDFLNSWKAKNYGQMASRAVNLTSMKHGFLAGSLRKDGELIELKGFQVLSVRQSTIARADAVVFMKGISPKGTVSGKFAIVAFRNTASGDIAMPSDAGTWQVQQGCMFQLMHERTIDKSSQQ